MANIVVLILCILLVREAVAPTPNPDQIVCSAFCAPSGCSGFLSSDCNGKCNTGFWGWTAVSGGACKVTGNNKYYLDSSDDAGGSITISYDPLTAGADCPQLLGYLGVAPYGTYKASDTFTITYAGGTDMPHYLIDLIFDIILIDTDDGNDKWETDSDTKFRAALAKPSGGPQTQSYGLNSGSKQYNTYCKTNKKDRFYQYQKTFSFNWLNQPIVFTISTTGNNKPNALWVAKQFIYVLTTCSIECLSCNNTGTLKVCFSCNPSLGYMLNNYSCLTTCTTGYGYTEDPALCIWCNLRCASCYSVFDNCTSCKTSNPWKSYLFYNDTLGYWICVASCPDTYFANTTSNTCELCDPVCATCNKNSTYCLSCINTYGWLDDYFCYSPCPVGYYVSNGTNNCTRCNLTCISCTDQLTCDACTINGTHKAYLLLTTCYNTTCPNDTYGDDNYGIGPTTCKPCLPECATCTGNPWPCLSCDLTYYLYNGTCSSTCPTGFFPYDPTGKCIDCNIYCVDVSIDLYFPNSYADQVYADLTFTKEVDFATFDYQNFQTISIEKISSGQYTISYQILDKYSYRIIIQPKGYIFLYNDTVSVTTMALPATLHTSTDSTPFKLAAYSKIATLNWFLLKSPEMSDLQKSIINNLGSFSSIAAKVTTAPFIAQMKKAGIFAMIFSGAQITSCAALVNTVQPQNMYEGVRFWGVYIFYDLPAWQKNSEIPNYIVTQDVYDLVKNNRRLFDMTQMYWRFQRTGHSSFFIYDVYIPMLLILSCWILAIVTYFLRKNNKNIFKGAQAKYFTVLHKFHEACILYVTIALIMEWFYFDGASTDRWVSLLICLVFTAYFVAYQLYLYYDMIKYPEALIGNEKYEYYLCRYGAFLKNLRYQEYDLSEQWSPKHWFRPYNYHILSYYKKFCMIISLPIFYDTKNMQAWVLVLLQILQIVRFIATKPYYKKWRNVYRFTLELLLLFFFIVVLVQSYIIEEIVLNNPDTLEFYVKIYYNLGWVGFGLVFAFNIGFLILFFIDVAMGFKYNSRELMDESRRVYYYDKILEYEKENEQVPLSLMNKWVRNGNLNKRNVSELPDINVRVEYFKLSKHSEYFDVDIFKICELYMNTDFNFHKENNTTPAKKIKKRIKLSRETSKAIYHLMCQVFKKYAKKDTETIVIKTFMHVCQRDFQAGDRIPLLPNEMFQKIELYNIIGEKDSLKLKEKLKGFPLNAHEVQSI